MALSFNGKEVNTINFNNNVGYIVAGSPTINDGVVSGFSTDDYVRTVKSFPTSNISTLEWGCKFTTGSNVNYQGITGTGSYWGCYGFKLGDYGALGITLSFSPDITIRFPASTIKSNSTYISKAYWNATTKEFSAKVSGDNGTTWTTSSMVVSDDFSYRDVPVQFGKTQAGAFTGSIDLNQTYIKVNGITWFSGKEQASKDVNYVIKDGKLVWANPNLYLEGDGLGTYIDTKIFGDGTTTIIAKYKAANTSMLYGARIQYARNALNAFCEAEVNLRLDYGNTAYINHNFNSWVWPSEGFLKAYPKDNNNYYFEVKRKSDNTLFYGTTPLQEFTTPGPIYLFASNDNGLVRAFGTSKFHYFKISNDSCSAHLVPVPTGLKIGNYTVPSNGMWDIVTQQFFGNSGTGEFSYGKDN